MLVEHSFVTTLETNPALEAASALLESIGFRVTQFGDAKIEARRGRNHPAKARSVAELPQRIEIELDRGRVEVAALLQERGKPKPLQQDFLLAVCRVLEAVLAHPTTADAAIEVLDEVNGRIEEDGRRQKRNYNIAIAVLVGLLVIIVLSTISALNR